MQRPRPSSNDGATNNPKWRHRTPLSLITVVLVIVIYQVNFSMATSISSSVIPSQQQTLSTRENRAQIYSNSNNINSVHRKDSANDRLDLSLNRASISVPRKEEKAANSNSFVAPTGEQSVYYDNGGRLPTTDSHHPTTSRTTPTTTTTTANPDDSIDDESIGRTMERVKRQTER